MLRVDDARDRRCGGFQTQDVFRGRGGGGDADEPDAQAPAQTSEGEAGGLSDIGGSGFSGHSRECPFLPYLKFI